MTDLYACNVSNCGGTFYPALGSGTTLHTMLTLNRLLAARQLPSFEALVERMRALKPGRKRLLVFAAAKFVSQKELRRLGVEFCQLPYAIHRILGD